MNFTGKTDNYFKVWPPNKEEEKKWCQSHANAKWKTIDNPKSARHTFNTPKIGMYLTKVYT